MSETPEQLADNHWEYVEMIMAMTYKTAFIHGYKHGQEASKSRISTGDKE